MSCQSLVGKPARSLVSSNLIRVLFSLSRMVSKPKLSLLTQSRPTQALPWTIRSSGITWSAAVTLTIERCGFTRGALSSLRPGPTKLPSTVMAKLPDCTLSAGSLPACRSFGGCGIAPPRGPRCRELLADRGADLRHDPQLPCVITVGAPVAGGVEEAERRRSLRVERLAVHLAVRTGDGQHQPLIGACGMPVHVRRPDAHLGHRSRAGKRQRNRRQGERQSDHGSPAPRHPFHRFLLRKVLLVQPDRLRARCTEIRRIGGLYHVIVT